MTHFLNLDKPELASGFLVHAANRLLAAWKHPNAFVSGFIAMNQGNARLLQQSAEWVFIE